MGSDIGILDLHPAMVVPACLTCNYDNGNERESMCEGVASIAQAVA